jgi:CheY-like chemotaxis protein
LELVIDSFNIQKCVKSVIDLLSFQAKDQGLNLICLWDATIPNFIRGDASRLRQILINLIGNALKFTSRGEVRVTISSEHIKSRTDYDEHLIKFAIRDTGIGISTENQAKLFKPFSQGDGRINRRYGGTGLGLVISQRLAALMGGDIWLESEVGVGSTFYFTIKATSILNGGENEMDYSCVLDKPCKESFAGAEVAKEGKTLPLKILVAEDNRVNQKVILLLLKKLGYQPDLAVNGLEVIRAVETCNYDVILMDMQMPEMDGISATKWIRENLPLSIQPHIIAMTANASKVDEKVCLSSGMNDFISKPFEFELVERKLKNLRRC